MEIMVDKRLLVRFKDIPDDLMDWIVVDLTVANPDYVYAASQGLWTGKIDAELALFDQEHIGSQLYLSLPRGYAAKLLSRCLELGIETEFLDDRVERPSPLLRWFEPLPLRDTQPKAADQLVICQQGILEAPPAFGKTVTVLEAIRRVRQRFCIIVNTTNIAKQWQQRCAEYLPGLPVGIVGDQLWEDDTDIVIALVQSLYARARQLRKDEWHSRFGGVCVDECHHVSASSYQQVISEFSGTYRWGVSATPDKGDQRWDVAQAMLGPIVYREKAEALREKGLLVKPTVVRIKTEFDFVYWGDHDVSAKQKCKVPDCRKIGTAHGHRNNFAKLTESLIYNQGRNRFIARMVSGQVALGHACLVLSKRLGHLDSLYDLATANGIERAFMLTGREDSDERMAVYAAAEAGSCVIYSTLADEAVDIPRLDRLFLIYPSRDAGRLRQQIGRIERPHPDKTDAVVYDFTDKPGVTVAQWSARVKGVYRKEKLDIQLA